MQPYPKYKILSFYRHILKIFSISCCFKGLKPGKTPPSQDFLAIMLKLVSSIPISVNKSLKTGYFGTAQCKDFYYFLYSFDISSNLYHFFTIILSSTTSIITLEVFNKSNPSSPFTLSCGSISPKSILILSMEIPPRPILSILFLKELHFTSYAYIFN